MRTLDDWKIIIENQENSGMSINEFCKANDISTASFYKNRKIIKPSVPSFNKVEVVDQDVPQTVEFTIDGHTIRCEFKYLHIIIGALL